MTGTLVHLGLVAVFSAPATYSLGNGMIERQFRGGQTWATTAIVCPADGWKARVTGGEFLVELLDGTVVRPGDWKLVAGPKLLRRGPERVLTVVLETDKVAGLRATLRYRLRDGQAWMRKQVEVAGPAGKIVSRVDLEPLKIEPAPEDHGGVGMPILVGGRLWFGVEYPGSYNNIRGGQLSLVHYPGKDLAGGPVTTKVAVCGLAQPGEALNIAFERYLDTVATGPRDFTHYNSWYDLRGRELSPERLLEVYRGFQEGLLKPYGLKLKAFVIDDGWQDRNSIWRPRRDLYPNGFGPLARSLEAEGTRLGLWMPLSGQNLNIRWGVEHGYEKSNKGNFYCLGGPRYYAAIRNATARLIREGNLAYYKHDFNHMRCSAPGHQHLPDDYHGREVNIDRTIALLHYERRLQPGIFLNVTSGMWYSPWWLMHADAIWGAFPGDTGYERSWPQLTRREWASSFRDAHLYRMYLRRPNNLFPISRLMTHGITQGRKNMLGGRDEPIREWTDYVMLYFGRGVQMRELYISPDRMRPDMWKAVGTGLRWALARNAILARTVMIGGDPREGKAYGFIHWRRDQGVWVLRNPALDEQTLSVPVDQSTGYIGRAKTLYAAVTYPYRSALASPVQPGEAYEVTIPPASVIIVEVRPRPWGRPAMAPAVRVERRQDVQMGKDEVVVSARAKVWAKAVRQARVYVVLRGGANGPCTVQCTGGLSDRSQTVTGPGWKMVMVPLERVGREIEVSVKLPPAQRKPFSRRPGTVRAWLVMELECSPGKLAAPPADLPWAIANGLRRWSTRLIDAELRPAKTQRLGISDEQLKQIAAAKLHLEVFGVNGGPYADKWIILNGHKLCRVPLNNQRRLDQWETKIIDLTPKQLKWLRRDNEIVLTNEPGDCYKVRNVALAVQLPDGRWVESEWATDVHCSVGGWLHAEGNIFPGTQSRAIRVRFPEPQK